jgi:hypothetical protein
VAQKSEAQKILCICTSASATVQQKRANIKKTAKDAV